MKYEHEPSQPDGGGNLRLTLETVEEVKAAIGPHGVIERLDVETLDELRQFTDACAQVVKGKPFIVESNPDKRKWYPIEGETLGCDFLEPYAMLLNKLTGYADTLDDLDLKPAVGAGGLHHTYALDTLAIYSGDIAVGGFIQSEDWNGRTAAELARSRFLEYLREWVGGRHHEPEYVGTANGQYKRNPNYLKRHPPEPGAGSPEVWSVIFAHWREHHATPGQRDMLAEGEKLRGTIGGKPMDAPWDIRKGGGTYANLVDARGFHYPDPDGAVKWSENKYAGFMPWEGFPKL